MNKRNLYLLVLLALMLLPQMAMPAWLTNEAVTVQQPDGTELHLLATGDEFYNWLHDDRNYTIIQSELDGYFYYADLVDDELIPSAYIVGSVDPASTYLVPGLLISAEKRTNIRKHMEEELRFGELGRSGGRAIGTLNNIVIYIRFSDQAEFTSDTTVNFKRFNDKAPAASSVWNYFKEVSYGQLDLPSTFYPVPPDNIIRSYQDAFPRSYYMPYNAVSNPDGYQTDNQRTQREHTLLANAVTWVNLNSPVPTHINLDYNNDGRVDNVVFIVRGATTAWSTLLWPHRWSLYSQTVFINGKRVWDFNFQLETSLQSSGVGVLCHELYHSLSAPDLYRYTDTQITPVGQWDVMASNNNPPQYMGAYMRMKYGGWISSIPQITEAGVYTLNPLSSSTNNAWRIASPNSSSQYFVLEYRRKAGTFDGTLPRSGLLIYRINLGAGNGNAQGPPDEVYIFRPNGSLTVNGSLGDAVFGLGYGRTTFHDNSNPNAFLQNGGPGGIFISEISAVGETMSFRVDFPGVPVAMATSNVKTSCPGETIQLIDQSTGMPNSWNWSFSPAGVNFLNGTNASSKNPIVSFAQPGNYSVSLSVTNNLGNSTIELPDYFHIGAEPGHFEDDFESNEFVTGSWRIQNPDNGVTWDMLPASGNGGQLAAGINFREYFSIMQRDRLISKPFDLSNLTSAYLSFQHAYAQNSTLPAAYSDSLIVLVSNDCGQSWIRLASLGENGSGNFATHPPTAQAFWPTQATDWCGNGWGSPCNTLDLSFLAGQSDVRIAFETVSFYGNPLLIDNVVVSQFVGSDEKQSTAALAVFPNPASQSIYIQLPDPNQSYEVSIYSLTGRMLHSEKLNGTILQRPAHLKAGMYTLQLKNHTGAYSTKLMLH